MALSRAQILAKKVELETETVDVPEWEGSVIVRQFTGSDTDAIASLLQQQNPRTRRKWTQAELRPHILMRACIDDDGQALFTSRDYEMLAGLPVRLTNRIVEALRRLNGGEDLEADLAENFAPDPSDDSPSS